MAILDGSKKDNGHSGVVIKAVDEEKWISISTIALLVGSWHADGSHRLVIRQKDSTSKTSTDALTKSCSTLETTNTCNAN